MCWGLEWWRGGRGEMRWRNLERGRGGRGRKWGRESGKERGGGRAAAGSSTSIVPATPSSTTSVLRATSPESLRDCRGDHGGAMRTGNPRRARSKPQSSERQWRHADWRSPTKRSPKGLVGWKYSIWSFLDALAVDRPQRGTVGLRGLWWRGEMMNMEKAVRVARVVRVAAAAARGGAGERWKKCSAGVGRALDGP